MADDTTGSVPEDRLLDSPLVGNPAKADITSGKVANTPDVNAGATDGDLGKLPDVTKIEQDIARNFFKGPKKSIDATAASLLNTKGTSVLQAYKQFVTGNGGKLGTGRVSATTTTASPTIGTTPQFKTRSDYVADAMHLAASRATIDMHRFHHAYSLPYMKRSLALAYDRTQMMRASVKLMDKTRTQLLAKLDAIKLNTAAPEAAKTSFREKVWDETRRQSISRLAASIQDLGFQYANRAYVSSVNTPLVKLRDRLSRGEKLSGVVRSSTLRGVERLNRMRDRSEVPETGLQKYLQSFRNSVLKAGVGVGAKIPANSKLLNVAGDVAYPLLDVASKFNPFNKSVFNPMASTTSSGAENFVGIDGSVQSISSASSPLLKAFTSWVREYRVDQHELQAILLGKKTKISDIRTGDPEKEALSAYISDVKRSNSSKSGGGIFSSLRSAIRDTRARYKARHVDKTSKPSVTEKVKTHFQTSTLAADVGGISAFFKSKTHVSADEVIDTLKDVKDPSQLRRIISDLGPKAKAVLNSPEARRLAVVAAAGNAALLTYLGVRNHVDAGALWDKLKTRTSSFRKSDTSDAPSSMDNGIHTVIANLSKIADPHKFSTVWNKLPESLRTRIQSVKLDKKTLAAIGTNAALLAVIGSTFSSTKQAATQIDRRKKKKLLRKAHQRRNDGFDSVLDHVDSVVNNPTVNKNLMRAAALAAGPIGTAAVRYTSSKLQNKNDLRTAWNTASGVVTGVRRKRRINRVRKKTTAIWNKSLPYVEQLEKFVQNPSIRTMIPEEMLTRIDDGEPVISVLPKALRNRIISKVTRGRHRVEDTLPQYTDRFISSGSDFVGRHLGPMAGATARESLDALRNQTASIFGSVSDNLKSVTDAMGVGSNDSIFRKYVKGIDDVNKSVSSGGRVFKSLVGIGLSKLGVHIDPAKLAGYKGTLIGKGISSIGYHLLDRSYRNEVLSQPVNKSLGRKAYETVRNTVYHPNELTNHEFAMKRREERIAAREKKTRDKQAAADRKAKRKADDDAYYERMRQKRIANEAKSRQHNRRGKPTAIELLLSKLTGKKTERLNSYDDQIRRDAERKRNAYTWRRAMGLGSRNDTHRYRDGYGLVGSGMDMYSNFASSALGSITGKALGLGWSATKLAGRGVGTAAHYGWRAFRGRGLAGAVRAGRGALPALGRGAMSLGKFALGPIGASMGVGLVAHELDVGINQNLTGKTRRIADTAAKAVEYGSMGFLFGGPVGAAIGAGVGALIANSDYAASALKGIGHVVMAGVRPLWHGIEAVGRGLWNVTKFTGRVAGGLWTTVFGQSAKVDRNGHVIRQHKASLMEDFRIAFFGRKEVRTRTGEIAVTGRNSIFGDVKYGFQKLLFGDKFSNGKYKPGTSLIDELGSGIKHAFLGTVHAVKNLPHTIANMFKSIWNRGTKSGKSVGHAAKEAFTDGIHGVASVGKSIGHFVKRPFSAAYDALQRKKEKIADDLKYAKEHPFKAAARVLMDTSIFSVIGTGTVRAAAGGFRAASAWLLESKAARDPSSPLYQYISTCLKAYGVSDRSMYDYLHTLETYQADIKSHKTAQYSSSDMAWICGKFGLDSSNPDCVNYFTTWYNHRFVPVTEILTNVLKTYKYDINNVFSAPTDVAKKINSDLDKAFQSLLDPSVSALVPTKEGYLKFSKKGSEKPSTMSPSSTQSQKPYDPRNPQSVVDTAKRAAKNPNAGYSGVNTDNFKAASGRSTPQMSQGKVTDQPEYKAAFSKLSGPLKNEVSKNKSLQFVLWSTSVQHGPIAAAKMFQTEYHPGTTTKNFIKDIYQSRSLKFVGNDSQDAVAAAQQLGQEQSFALQMDSGATDPSLQDMGNAIGHPIMGLGDGGAPIQTAPLTGSVKSRAADAVNYLMSKYKLPAFKADALVGNFIQESKLDYTNQSGDGGHAHGIAQWHGDRRAAIQKQFGKPVEAMDLHGQLDAVMWEMSSNGPERAGGAAFQRATNVNQAIDALVNGYERPADRAGNIRVRTALAEQVGKDLGNLNNQNTPQQGGANVVAAPDIGPAASGNRNVQTASNVTLDKNAQASLQAHADALNNHAKAMVAATPVLASTNIPSASAPASTTHVVNSAPVIVASNQTNKQSQQDISLSKHSVTTGLASM